MFSVGDIVILKTDVGDCDKGIKGKVREIRLQEKYPYYVSFFNKEYREYQFYENELSLARLRNTKLARKLYPHKKVKGDWIEL